METLLALLAIRDGNPLVTSGPHRKEPVMFSMVCEKAVDQTIELYTIWDTKISISCYCNGASAGSIWSIYELIVIQILHDISL